MSKESALLSETALMLASEPEEGAGTAVPSGLETPMQVRGLLRLRGWAAGVGGRRFWRLVPGIAWKFVPAALLVGLQPLVGFFGGRVFSYPQLFWAMPDVVSWLILGVVLGGVAGTARVVIVARRTILAAKKYWRRRRCAGNLGSNGI